MDFDEIRESASAAKPITTRCGLKSNPSKTSLQSFEGGSGVVLPIGAEPRPVTREEVVMLWQPARLPLEYLFPGCSQHLNSMNELDKIKNGLLYGAGGGVRAAIMAHVRYGNRIEYEPGGKRHVAAAAKKQLETLKSEEEEHAETDGAAIASKEEEERGVGEKKAVVNRERIGTAGDSSESEDEVGASPTLADVEAVAVNDEGFDVDEDDDDDDDFDRTPAAVFATSSFYRTMVTISGHYDCLSTAPGRPKEDKKGAGLVIGVPNQQMFAKPGYLNQPAVPPQPAAAPSKGFRSSMASTFSSAPSPPSQSSADVALSAVMNAASAANHQNNRAAGKRLSGSPFDDSLRLSLGTISIHELRDYDITNEAQLSSTAPPPEAVQFRSVFGHLY
jgi:hypothetical protein